MKSKQNTTKTPSKNTVDKKRAAQIQKEREAAEAAAAERERIKNDPVRREKIAQITSIVLGVLALLFIVSFVFKGVNESGFFGRVFGDLLYGMFSLPAWLIPILMFYFAVVYRKESMNGTLFVRVVMTVAAFLTFLCIYFYFSVGLGSEEFSLSPASIWNNGLDFKGSGLVGSYLGYAIFRIFGKVGTPIVLFPLFAVLLVFLFGWTPRQAYLYCKGKLIRWYGAFMASKAEKKKADEQKKVTKEVATSGVGLTKMARQGSASRADVDDVIGTGTGSAKKKGLEECGIDIETGEVLDEDAITAPKIRQYGMTAAAAKEDSKQSKLKGGTAADIDTLMDFEPREEEKKEQTDTATVAAAVAEVINPPKPVVKKAIPAPLQESELDKTEILGSDVDLVAMLEQSKKESTGGEFSHPEQTELPFEPDDKPAYTFPPETLLKSKPAAVNEDISEELNTNAYKLVETLRSFKVRTKVINVSRGPTITRYELAPEEGVRVRAISNLIDDIALNLATTGVRIEAPIPGKAAVGVEVPNKTRETVYLKDLIANDAFRSASAKLTTAVGMDVAGDPVYMDLAKLPHLLIAGTTGSGKSVCMNCLILSLLYKADPNEVKLIMIDPKKVEFSIYNGLPHLITPVVSSAKKAAGALSWAVNEMERRYELIETVGVRDIKSYNKITKDDPAKEFMPQLVIIIDELADLMMTAPGDVEESICRIAQKGRACGMHLIVGTQRPSVDVITGLIKANIPSRIAFTVSSQMDSRTIIDGAGAEKLIGRGDMLFSPIGMTKPVRVQGAFVSDAEVEAVVKHVISQSGETVYDDSVMRDIEKEAELCGSKKKANFGDESDGGLSGSEGSDPMLRSAIELAVESGKISTSLIQRRLSLGYGRAAKLIDQMQDMGIVGPQEGQKPRNVLISASEWAEMVMRQSDGQ